MSDSKGPVKALSDEYAELLGMTVSNSPVTVGSGDTLFVIDMQNDFAPGGSFAVEEGDKIVGTIANLMTLFR